MILSKLVISFVVGLTMEMSLIGIRNMRYAKIENYNFFSIFSFFTVYLLFGILTFEWTKILTFVITFIPSRTHKKLHNSLFMQETKVDYKEESANFKVKKLDKFLEIDYQQSFKIINRGRIELLALFFEHISPLNRTTCNFFTKGFMTIDIIRFPIYQIVIVTLQHLPAAQVCTIIFLEVTPILLILGNLDNFRNNFNIFCPPLLAHSEGPKPSSKQSVSIDPLLLHYNNHARIQ